MDENLFLKAIADNPALKEALRKLLEKQFDLSDISTNMTNENIGAMVRARLDGLVKIAAAFKTIDKYRTMPERMEKINHAR